MERPVFLQRSAACRWLGTAFCLTQFAVGTWAQPQRRGLTVTGEIEGPTFGGELAIELRGSGIPFDRGRVLVSAGGRFEFTSVPEGQYELIVSNLNVGPIHREFVAIGEGRNFLRVNIERAPPQLPAGTVSVHQLQRRIPRKAVKEYAAALSKAQKGSRQDAVDHLKKALDLAPDYMEAHNELGLCYVLDGRFEAAAKEFQTAVDLDPDAAPPASNLSMAYYLLKRPGEAETAARRALRLESGMTKARYLLGMSLHAQGKFDAEALEELRRVAGEFPRARLALADALARLGRKDDAAAQLREYLLKPGDVQNRHEVEGWLAELER